MQENSITLKVQTLVDSFIINTYVHVMFSLKFESINEKPLLSSVVNIFKMFLLQVYTQQYLIIFIILLPPLIPNKHLTRKKQIENSNSRRQMLSLTQVDTYLGARLFCKGFISVDSDLCDQETTTIRDLSTIVKGELDQNNCMHAYTCYCSLSKKLTWFLHTKYTQIKKTQTCMQV